jgi:DNA-binding MarR family transcriptional regulator
LLVSSYKARRGGSMTYYLGAEEWLKICKELKHSEISVFLYIKTLSCDAVKIADIAHELKLPKTKVVANIKTLVKLGYLTANEVTV